MVVLGSSSVGQRERQAGVLGRRSVAQHECGSSVSVGAAGAQGSRSVGAAEHGGSGSVGAVGKVGVWEQREHWGSGSEEAASALGLGEHRGSRSVRQQMHRGEEVRGSASAGGSISVGKV